MAPRDPCQLPLNNLPETRRRWADVSPRTVPELVAAVQAAANGTQPAPEPCAPSPPTRSAKALGSGWGFSMAGSTEGTRIRCTNLTGVEPPTELLSTAKARPLPPNPIMPNEAPGPLMRVYAGTSFAQLDAWLGPLAARNQPGFGNLTFGGVMMVGGHGSGIVEGNIASQVRSMDLVVVNAQRQAELVRIEPARDPITDSAQCGARLLVSDSVFDCAKVSFGTMGVLASVIIDTRPAYRLEEDRDLRRLWRDFDKIHSQVHDPATTAVHLWINPYDVGGDFSAVQSTYRRSFDMQRNERGSGIRGADSNVAVWFATTLAAHFPRLLPLAHELALRTVIANDVVMPSVEALDFGPPNRLAVAAASCSIPADDLKPRLEALLAHFAEGFGRTFVSSPVGLRWVKASDAPLAPQAGRDSVMIEVPVLVGTQHLDETLSRYVDFMVTKLGARPHWGQRFSLTAAQLRTVYGQAQVQQFIASRRQLDPLGIFDNVVTQSLGL